MLPSCSSSACSSRTYCRHTSPVRSNAICSSTFPQSQNSPQRSGVSKNTTRMHFSSVTREASVSHVSSRAYSDTKNSAGLGSSSAGRGVGTKGSSSCWQRLEQKKDTGIVASWGKKYPKSTWWRW